MKYSALLFAFLISTTAWGQEANETLPSDRADAEKVTQSSDQADQRRNPRNSRSRSNHVPNPFDDVPQPTMGMSMDMEMEMDDMMDDMGMGGMGMGATSPTRSIKEAKFRSGLQRAIAALSKSKSDDEKAVLRGHVRDAFEKRYDETMASRKKDIDRLRKSIARLESDLQRRVAAKDRVIQLQLQSVQLAAEGLLDLGDLQGSSGSVPGGGGFEGYGEEMGEEMGFEN